MVNFNTLFDGVAKTLFDTFEGVPQTVTVIQIVDEDPANDVAVTKPFRAIFLDLTEERAKLVDNMTMDFRDAKIIQSELLDLTGAAFTPSLEDRIKDASNVVWTVKRVNQDPAGVSYTLMLMVE